MRTPALAAGALVVSLLGIDCGSRADLLGGESSPGPSGESSSGRDASASNPSGGSSAGSEACDGAADCHDGLGDAGAQTGTRLQCVGLQCSGRPAAVHAEDAGSGGGGDDVACVDVDLSKYDRSCKRSSDCIYIAAGRVCRDDCSSCGDAVVNVAGRVQYEQAIAPLGLSSRPGASCHCPDMIAPSCVEGRCTICPPVPTPDRPAGCG